MATPPPVSAADATAAIERIRHRRIKIDDPQVWRLSDEVVDALLYLQRYSQGVPSWVRAADVQDGIVLRLRLWWVGQEAELWLLEAGRRAGVPYRVLGRPFGISTKQGVRDRLQSAREKVALLRAEPGRSGVPHREADEQDAEVRWIRQNRDLVLRTAAAVEEHHGLGSSDAQEWLADVARDLRDAVVTPGSFQLLRFAAAELAASPAVLDSPADHLVLQALERWSELYDSYIKAVRRPA